MLTLCEWQSVIPYGKWSRMTNCLDLSGTAQISALKFPCPRKCPDDDHSRYTALMYLLCRKEICLDINMRLWMGFAQVLVYTSMSRIKITWFWAPIQRRLERIPWKLHKYKSLTPKNKQVTLTIRFFSSESKRHICKITKRIPLI